MGTTTRSSSGRSRRWPQPCGEQLDGSGGATDNGAMIERVPGLPFSLDPLMAEAKRRARRRRLLALGLLLVVVATGTTLALRGSGGSGPPTASTGNGLSTASLGQASLTYPASWKRVVWDCWSNAPGRYLLLTTARPTPTCGRALPPREKLGRDGVAVWLQTLPALPGITSQKLIRDPRPATGAWTSEKRATCTSGPGRNFGARVKDGNLYVLLGAVVCGPGYGQGERALQRMVSSARFTK